MAKVIQRRRGTTAEHSTFAGALAETTIDTTKKTVVVHDGSTLGGHPLAREDLTNVTGTLVIANGGTGATTAANALAALGAVPRAGGSGAVMTGSLYTRGSFGMFGGITGNPLMYDVQDQAGATVLEIGRQDNVAATTAIDIHTGATNIDFDTRLSFTGGNGVSGNGNLDIRTGTLQWNGQTILTASNTLTLTNKRITPRINTITTAATITPSSDISDQYNITALTQAATFEIPSGTPTTGQKLSIRIKAITVSRTISWVTTAGGYRAIGTVLPLTAPVGKTIYVGCIYNAADSFWDVVAVAIEE